MYRQQTTASTAMGKEKKEKKKKDKKKNGRNDTSPDAAVEEEEEGIDPETATSLTHLAAEMQRGVTVRTRRHRFRSYKQCFLGSEAVAWLVGAGKAKDAAEALKIGHQMGRLGLFKHVHNEHKLKNKYLFYVFTLENTCFGGGEEEPLSSFLPGGGFEGTRRYVPENVHMRNRLSRLEQNHADAQLSLALAAARALRYASGSLVFLLLLAAHFSPLGARLSVPAACLTGTLAYFYGTGCLASACLRAAARRPSGGGEASGAGGGGEEEGQDSRRLLGLVVDILSAHPPASLQRPLVLPPNGGDEWDRGPLASFLSLNRIEHDPVLEQVRGAVVVSDNTSPSQRIVYATKQFCRLTGYKQCSTLPGPYPHS